MYKIIFSKEGINSLRDADKYGSNLSNLSLHFLSKLNILWGGAEQTFSRIVYFVNKGDLDDDDDGDDGGVDDDGDDGDTALTCCSRHQQPRTMGLHSLRVRLTLGRT